MTLHRRRWGIVWPSDVSRNLSLPQTQRFATGARSMASSSQDCTLPGSPSHPQLARAANMTESKSAYIPPRKNASQPGVYQSGGTTKKQKLTPLPPLPSLYSDRQNHQAAQAGPSTHSAQPPNSGTTQGEATQDSLSPRDRHPFCLGISHLEDPFTRTPESGKKPSSKWKSTNQGVTHDAPLAGNRGPQSTSKFDSLDPYIKTPGPELRVSQHRGQAQQPLVRSLDALGQPISNTAISPEESRQVSSTTVYPMGSSQWKANIVLRRSQTSIPTFLSWVPTKQSIPFEATLLLPSSCPISLRTTPLILTMSLPWSRPGSPLPPSSVAAATVDKNPSSGVRLSHAL